MLTKIRAILGLIGYSLSLGFQRLLLFLGAKIHQRSYRSVPKPKNVVVIGGSFAGYFAAKQLAESLPTGYRVVLIERHSHFHFTWNFPRITVVPGHDHKAFVPYPAQPKLAPGGAYLFKRGNVISIDIDKVTLEDGSVVEYDYLAIATGSGARYPANLQDHAADQKRECVKFFQRRQREIETAKTIVIVGGGAAGVEVAGDIKSKHPGKSVTLVHSRDHLLNNFGDGLHDTAKKALEEMGIHLHLGERVVAGLDADSPTKISLSSGKLLECDMVIKCTGQHACSNLLEAFSPSSISPNGAILVEQTLQVRNTTSPKIFALGDVVDLPGPKMGRAATMQGFLVAQNIVRAIEGKTLKPYKNSMIDRSIELTLGVGNNVMYVNDGSTEMSFSRKMSDEAMHASQVWKMMDAKPFEDPGDVQGVK